jgi:mannose-1-phosphate guanylyltransferase/phosphomannomutase
MKAMVLSAGYGTRLGNLTSETPKPMLQVAGRPLLAYVLANLRRHGFNQLAINLHFKPEAIRDYFGDGSPWRLQLTYSDEPELLGTAGGVIKLVAFFRSEAAFLVHYGDVLTDQDLTALVDFHQRKNALATLLLHQRARSNSVVNLDPSGQITGFLERPTDAQRLGNDSPWVNSGVCVCSPAVLDHIPGGIACDFPRDVFTKLVNTGRLFGFPLSGYRCAIDSPERLEAAALAILGGTCRMQPLESPADPAA